MGNTIDRESLKDMFVFETLELLENLEELILDSEKTNRLEGHIDEIFRVMHTIKGSAAMMSYKNIVSVSHSMEDAFQNLRKGQKKGIDYTRLTDIVLDGIDFIKNEVSKIQAGRNPDGDSSIITDPIEELISSQRKEDAPLDWKQDENMEMENSKQNLHKPGFDEFYQYRAIISFSDGCGMENIRAFNVIHNLKEIASIISYEPSNIIEDQQTAEIIRDKGIEIFFNTTLDIESVREFLLNTIYLKELKLEILDQREKDNSAPKREGEKGENTFQGLKQSMINVNVPKLDRLMDLVGELVIAQAMVIQNPDVNGLILDNFEKASRHLQKVTNELQDAVMSIRMVPLSVTFQKMNRIVRDMCRKMGKDVHLEIIGENTEVDKNIIEHISDPLIHLVRNAVDHGIESPEERRAIGKGVQGKITLEAKNEGGDVWIIIRDDGKGLDKKKIFNIALEHGLVNKPENQLNDREIYSLVFLPGFSTKEEATEFSGRGVGMDVVNRNIEQIGGTISVESNVDIGTSISIKIPLTLAIIDGMKVRVGKSTFIIPTTSIKESFRIKESGIIRDDINNSEMIMIRGSCYPILRLHESYGINTEITKLHEGITIMVENETGALCLFADELLGEQQVVVKALPRYIKKAKGITGCTVMGDGSVSLIIDVTGILGNQE